mmetsp:Transcript_30717/g.70813  ORF Transcript_30717/g.70813 Transcript_30717/m.70813 type:complete len:228 (+) Transcript_30717:46-729(+)
MEIVMSAHRSFKPVAQKGKTSVWMPHGDQATVALGQKSMTFQVDDDPITASRHGFAGGLAFTPPHDGEPLWQGQAQELLVRLNGAVWSLTWNQIGASRLSCPGIAAEMKPANITADRSTYSAVIIFKAHGVRRANGLHAETLSITNLILSDLTAASGASTPPMPKPVLARVLYYPRGSRHGDRTHNAEFIGNGVIRQEDGSTMDLQAWLRDVENRGFQDYMASKFEN